MRVLRALPGTTTSERLHLHRRRGRLMRRRSIPLSQVGRRRKMRWAKMPRPRRRGHGRQNLRREVVDPALERVDASAQGIVLPAGDVFLCGWLHDMPLALRFVSPLHTRRARLCPSTTTASSANCIASIPNDAYLSHRIFLRLHSVQLSACRRRFFFGGSWSSRSSPSDPYEDGG
ncbi:hypothetical protein C8R47DRAFT_1109166 [Mycena vitilis]|nr:hypothetical protein C8R47DRAFT_1109166 [Mycena vitilis]